MIICDYAFLIYTYIKSLISMNKYITLFDAEVYNMSL